jgi:hypothetical protein
LLHPPYTDQAIDEIEFREKFKPMMALEDKDDISYNDFSGVRGGGRRKEEEGWDGGWTSFRGRREEGQS